VPGVERNTRRFDERRQWIVTAGHVDPPIAPRVPVVSKGNLKVGLQPKSAVQRVGVHASA
jgi:hypothetical protein